jgi:mRNA-degrading endonuclease toxin of MazEF toxin-antitoxin module
MRRGDLHLVRLDPTLGREIKKTRPCLVVSPDELNQHLRTVVVAPVTTGGQPTRGESGVGSRDARDSWRWTGYARWIRTG